MNKHEATVELYGYGRIPFVDAELPQALEIRVKDVENARCGDPRKCVLAQACRRAFGKHFHGVLVFKTMLHIVFQKEDGSFYSRRHAIAGVLQKAVDYFDKSRQQNGEGTWNLLPGIYWLAIPSPTAKHGGRPNRRKLYGGKGGKQQRGIQMMQAVTRRILARNQNAIIPGYNEACPIT